jgi:hypothetical protein
MMNDINQERKNAVREAWKNERGHVRSGMGTRDWSETEQREISSLGRATGYEGHHMRSVKDYPQYAGDSQNIQFLNRSEHVNGAHRGNTQNSTNGYYDPETGKMHSFGNGNHTAPEAKALSQPLYSAQDSNQQAMSGENKGIESYRSKVASNDSSNAPQASQNKGIADYQSISNGQSASSVNSSGEGQSSGSGQGR